jgi:hypothetical protein
MKNSSQKSKLHRSVLSILAFTIILAGVVGIGLLWQPATVQGATTYYGYIAGIEKQATAYTMLGKVNAARQNVSVSPLKWDTTLENAAVIRAREVAIYFSHTRPTGAAWNTVCSKLNAENIYVGYQATATTANSGWMNSTGHRTNRLNSAYKSYGAAAFQGKDGAVYWVEVFSKTTSTSTTYRNVDLAKNDLPVRVTDGYLAVKSSITNTSRATIADTSMRVGGTYYLTLKNTNKGFTYSYSLFSRGYFSSSNTAIATIDSITGKITPKRAGVLRLYGRVSTASTTLLNREVVIRPQAVTGLVATAKVKSASIKWNPVAGASGFEIYRSTSLSGTYTKVASVSAAATTYTNSGLTTGVTYYYKVHAYVLKSGSTTRYTGYDSAPVPVKVL